MKKEIVAYPAYLSNEGDCMAVVFPDLPECCFEFPTNFEFRDIVEDLLGKFLYEMEMSQKALPQPSKTDSFEPAYNEVVTTFEVDMVKVRKRMRKG